MRWLIRKLSLYLARAELRDIEHLERQAMATLHAAPRARMAVQRRIDELGAT